MSFDHDERDLSQRQLELILKDVNLVKPMILKGFKNDEVVTGSAAQQMSFLKNIFMPLFYNET